MKPKLVSFKKDTIIQALKTEPLRAGNWFHQSRVDSAVEDSFAACEVCAVGAVFRSHPIAFKAARNIFGDLWLWITGKAHDIYPYDGRLSIDGSGDTAWLLKKKLYLAALSNYFEHFFSDRDNKTVTLDIRKKLVSFVKKNFPAIVKLELT